MTAELVLPDVRYRASYLEAVREFIADRHHRYVEVNVAALDADFAAFVEHERSILPVGNKVPNTNYWLVEGDTFIGRVSLRHHLNDFLRRFGGHIGYEIRPSRRCEGHGRQLLALVLEKARERGMDRVMLTCDVTNTGSRRIIESNGGVLEDIQTWPEVNPEPYMRWWIMLDGE